MKPLASALRHLPSTLAAALLVLIGGAPLAAPERPETRERSRIAAASLEDAIVVDCQLPGKLRKLGGQRTYLTPGVLMRLSAVDCRARGGEYTIGDLASGTLSIQRWLPLAQQGQVEAQYYVARIYANGMGDVEVDYARAAQWYGRAAEQGFSPAVQELGYLYEQGLGVPKDAVRGLNLQRRAAGLGDELDYAWKVAAVEEEAARQVAALSEQLSESNVELNTLRAKLQDTTRAMFTARDDLARAEAAVAALHERLDQASGTHADDANVRDLQAKLADRERELEAAQQRTHAAAAELQIQRTQLSKRMEHSQLASFELNELLQSEQARSQALEARLAQADQRLLRSQQELTDLRTEYRAEVETMLAERAALERASKATKDQVAALLAVKERDLSHKQQAVAALEAALATRRREQAAAQASATAEEEARSLRTALAGLQAHLERQRQLLLQRESEIDSLRGRAKNDREALLREVQAQLGGRSDELAEKERRLKALAAETEALRGEFRRLSAQRDKQAEGASSEAARARASLRMAQQKLNEQREKLDRLQVEKASEMAALAKARDELRRELAASRQAGEMQTAFLTRNLEARQADLQARDREIARLEERLAEQSERFEAMMAQALGQTPGRAKPGAPAVLASVSPASGGGNVKMRSADSRPDAIRDSLQQLRTSGTGTYHALVIGNSLYHYMEALDTPANDSRAVAELLRERYGFKVRLLLDATREQIMTALHDAKLELTAEDSLLIYYAGHGDIAGPAGRAFWLGVEADPDTRAGWLEADHIRAKIKEMSAKHVLLVADSCFSGAITHPKTTTIGRGLNETRLRVQWSRRARMVLTSGQVTSVPDSTGDGSHSAFARYFIQVLRHNETIMSGEMLSHELSERMRAQPVSVGAAGERQTPTYSTLQDANHDVGDFFFVPAMQGTRLASLSY